MIREPGNPGFPSALAPGVVRPDTLFTGIEDIQTWLVEVIEYHMPRYLHPDLPAPKLVVGGDPLQLTRFPTIAVFPEEGDLQDMGCNSLVDVGEGTNGWLYMVRVYLENSEVASTRNAFWKVAAYLTALIVIILEHPQLAEPSETSNSADTGVGEQGRVRQTFPERWAIGEFVKADRQSYARIRGGALEARVKPFASRIQKSGS